MLPILLAIAAATHPVRAQPSAQAATMITPVAAVQAATVTTPLVQAVAGIISFTRWPLPHDAITLCLLEPAEGTDGFFATPMVVGSLPVHPRRVTLAGEGLNECNALYMGRLTMAERRLLFLKLEGLPVLTMGEASPECTELTMFCLRQNGPVVTFSTNIDMIARGGVRLSPRVLQLGRKPVVP